MVIVTLMAKYDPNLSLIFQALSDPTRRDMLARLGGGAVAVSELARPTGLRLPTILRHLAVLEEAHLITTTKQGRTRMCHPVPTTLGIAKSWLDERRLEWEARTDRLEAFLETLEDENDPEP
jgi:DNA-binding transcriptional ArsR family regulator